MGARKVKGLVKRRVSLQLRFHIEHQVRKLLIIETWVQRTSPILSILAQFCQGSSNERQRVFNTVSGRLSACAGQEGSRRKMPVTAVRRDLEKGLVSYASSNCKSKKCALRLRMRMPPCDDCCKLRS